MNTYKKFFLVLAVVGSITGLSLQAFAESNEPAPAAPGSTFDQRLVQRKAEQNVTLAQIDQVRLISRCTSAQVKVRAMQVKQVPQLADRLHTYRQIDAKILVVIGELKLANKDTFELEKSRLDLANKTNDFQTASTNFNQAIDDILVINCKADAVGFKALLETIRSYFTTLQTQTAGIHDLTVNTIKPQLAAHGDALQTKTVTDGSTN